MCRQFDSSQHHRNPLIFSGFFFLFTLLFSLFGNCGADFVCKLYYTVGRSEQGVQDVWIVHCYPPIKCNYKFNDFRRNPLLKCIIIYQPTFSLESKIGLPVYWKAEGVGTLGTRTVGCGLHCVIAAGFVRTAMFYQFLGQKDSDGPLYRRKV